MTRSWIVLFLFFSAIASAQPYKSIEQLNKEETLKKGMATLEEFEAKLKKLTIKVESDCMKAFGYKPFCDCLTSNLPVAWSFNDYISITTRTKEENGYTKLDSEHRAAYDKVNPIRDECVKK